MIHACSKCGHEGDATPSISLLHELIKANHAYGELSEKYEVAENFIRKIVHDWGCDQNHAAAILVELERVEK